EQVLREFRQNGSEIRTVLLAPVQGAQQPGRDLVFDPSGQVYVYTGASDPVLSSYTPAGGGWTQNSSFGWSTYDQYGFGGIGRLNNYVFVTDMSTNTGPGDELKGVVRFNTLDGTSQRFLENEEPIDLTIGKDNRLYLLLPGNIVKKYDPNTFALLGTVQLPGDSFSGIAVNSAGQIFAVSFSEKVYRLSPAGALLGSAALNGVYDPIDIDVSGTGKLAIGTRSGHVVQMSENLTGVTTFVAGGDHVYVAYGPDESQTPPPPPMPTLSLMSPPVVVPEGDSGVSYAVFNVTLFGGSPDPVAFHYATLGGDAYPGIDYEYTAGTRIMYPGETSTQILVPI